MAKKAVPPAPSSSKAVTAERAARLYRLLKLVSARPQTREALRRRLRLDVRGFYRDLELLRASGIELDLVKRRYVLSGDVDDLLGRLPFPDPHLTLGEAAVLAQGRTKAHRRLKEQLARIEGR